MFKNNQKIYLYREGIGSIEYTYFTDELTQHHLIQANTNRIIKISGEGIKEYRDTEEGALALWYSKEKIAEYKNLEEQELNIKKIKKKIKELEKKFNYLENDYPEEFI